MRLRYSILLDKAKSMMDHPVAMADRTGEQSPWVLRSRQARDASALVTKGGAARKAATSSAEAAAALCERLQRCAAGRITAALRERQCGWRLIERNPEGAYMPRGYMLGFQGYAPLEEAANALVTPNPAKAPWYFLGLQEIVTDTTIRLGSFTINGAFLGGVLLPGALFTLMTLWPWLDITMRNHFVRGAVSGVGLITAWAGVKDLSSAFMARWSAK